MRNMIRNDVSPQLSIMTIIKSPRKLTSNLQSKRKRRSAQMSINNFIRKINMIRSKCVLVFTISMITYKY